MKIAINVFADKHIIDLIKKTGTTSGACDITNQKDVEVFDLDQSSFIANDLATIINLYSIYGNKSETNGERLFEKIVDDWDIFKKPIDKNYALQILQAIFQNNEGIIDVNDLTKDASLSNHDEEKNNYFVFKDNDWNDFAVTIKNKNRFHFDSLNIQLFKRFLEAIICPIGKTTFFRGRICGSNKLSDDEMKIPPSKYARSSRVSPQYIPTLYLCNNLNTVPNECRASCNDCLTIASFELKEESNVFDLRLADKLSPFDFPGEELFVYYNKKSFKHFANELTKPMTSFDTDVDYLPIQYLCEYMKYYSEQHKERKIIGIVYKSVMTKSPSIFNLAAFSDSMFDYCGSELYKITEYKSVLKCITEK